MTFPTFTPTVGELVTRAAAAFGDEILLVSDGRRHTFAELDGRSRSIVRSPSQELDEALR